MLQYNTNTFYSSSYFILVILVTVCFCFVLLLCFLFILTTVMIKRCCKNSIITPYIQVYSIRYVPPISSYVPHVRQWTYHVTINCWYISRSTFQMPMYFIHFTKMGSFVFRQTSYFRTSYVFIFIIIRRTSVWGYPHENKTCISFTRNGAQFVLMSIPIVLEFKNLHNNLYLYRHTCIRFLLGFKCRRLLNSFCYMMNSKILWK